MIQITKCPSCGSRKIKIIRRNLKRTYKAMSYTVSAVEFHECPDCGEHVYDRETMK